MSTIYWMLQEPRKLDNQYLTRRSQICFNRTKIKKSEEEVIMRKVLVLTIILIIAFATVCMAEYGHIKDLPELSATMSGSEVVPPIKTDAKGKATFSLNKERSLLFYTVTASDIENITAAHIHIGKVGENGPPIALIAITAKNKGKISGTLAEGSIGAEDLMSSFKGKTVWELYQQLTNGDYYINIHTEKYPDGEIRGQIK